MAGTTKNGKPAAAPAKAKVAEKAPAAAPAKAAMPEAKPVAKPAEVKPAAAPAPKPVAVAAKPAAAPAKVEAKAEPKPAAKPVEKAPAKPSARVVFNSAWKQTVEGELVGGGQLTLSYEPARAQLQHKNGDKPAWGVQAYVKLVPSGQVFEQPAVDFNGANAKPRPVVVEIPKGTTELQVWFKNWAATDKPSENWDSNFGLNYKFSVRP